MSWFNNNFPATADRLRREFLKLTTVVLTALVGVVLGIPLVGSVVGPAFRSSKKRFVKLLNVASLPVNQPVSVTFVDQTQDAYLEKTSLRSVWVVKQSTEKITIYSPICPHLGCQYNWNSHQRRFECPCHGSVFSLYGNVINGPAARPLDTLPAKVEGGELYVEWEKFKLGISAKISV